MLGMSRQCEMTRMMNVISVNCYITSSPLRFCGWVGRTAPPETGPLSGPPPGDR